MNASRFFVERPAGARKRIEDAIEILISILDAIDGDADLEEEPDLEDGHDVERDEAEIGL